MRGGWCCLAERGSKTAGFVNTYLVVSNFRSGGLHLVDTFSPHYILNRNESQSRLNFIVDLKLPEEWVEEKILNPSTTYWGVFVERKLKKRGGSSPAGFMGRGFVERQVARGWSRVFADVDKRWDRFTRRAAEQAAYSCVV